MEMIDEILIHLQAKKDRSRSYSCRDDSTLFKDIKLTKYDKIKFWFLYYYYKLKFFIKKKFKRD